VRVPIIILLSLSTLTVAGQTRLYIIGTVHTRTRNFNSDSIVNILTKLKPDLILLEFDSSFFDSNFNFKIKLRTNETLGVKKYIAKHPSPIRPFDIKGRRQAKKTTNLEIESIDRLSSIVWKLDSSQKQTYLDFKRSIEELTSFLKKKPYEINRKYTYDLVEKTETLMYKDLLDVIESRKELEDLRLGFRQSGVFWYWRNKKMVDNTLVFLNMDSYKNKTIVLFTGFYHKCYLLNELLTKQAQYEFVVKEYYQ
jgi:hypothetical protein